MNRAGKKPKKTRKGAKGLNVVRTFTFNCDEELKLLKKCLTKAKHRSSQSIEVNDEHLQEMAPFLADAIEWARAFEPEKTSRELERLKRWANSIESLVAEIRSTLPGFKAIRLLEESKKWVEFRSQMLQADRVRRNVRPYKHLDERTGKPSTQKIEDHLIDLFTKSPADLKPKVNDTKQKPMLTFFHSASVILNNVRGKQVFLGTLYDQVYRPVILNDKATNEDPVHLYERVVKDLIRKGSSLS
jgi:hypothetical protein